MTEQQREYHHKRASEELARAAAATDDGAERIHRQLAQLHSERALAEDGVVIPVRIGRAINPDDEIIADKRPHLRVVAN